MTRRPRGAFVPGPDSRRVRIATVPSMTWLFETIPSAIPVERGRIGRSGRYSSAGDAWLERLLLRLGPEAAVVEPTDDQAAGPRGGPAHPAPGTGSQLEKHEMT